ncbi:spore germination protein [Paenibacillus ginsengarvi]|uniref:spore germination protein n=1 Tax=Paenibacillus ginsengarvi TaxID=400777 RepID=UPI0026BAAE95
MFFRKKGKSGTRQNSRHGQLNPQGQAPKKTLHTSLEENIRSVREALGNSTDLVIRELGYGENGEVRQALLYTDGLADEKMIAQFVMDSAWLVSRPSAEPDRERTGEQRDLHARIRSFGSAGDMRRIADMDGLFNALLSGDAVILTEGHSEGCAAGMRAPNDRSVTEPTSESVVRGPREAFTETLRTNTALIRRKIKSPNLWMETKQIGEVTKTDVAIMFIRGIASDKVVEEVRLRLDRIRIDGILESGYIEELIQDETITPFPTMYNTERPDVIAAELLEGKVAIIVDGTPFVLVVPALFVSFIHAAEDYYHRADISSLIRLLRYIGMFISLLGPSLYIAITTFHQEMLPTDLLISLAAAREGVPFPAFIEALIMEVTFEILREAGIRMPRTIGPAVSVVGTLVIGQAAVEAGIVSSAMVIIVAITAISNFVFPSYSMANSFRMLRFFFMGLAAIFGLFGIIVGIVAMVLHLSSLRSFGIPYMSPFAPWSGSDQKDALIRAPWWAMLTRPRLIQRRNAVRQTYSPPKAKPRQ